MLTADGLDEGKADDLLVGERAVQVGLALGALVLFALLRRRRRRLDAQRHRRRFGGVASDGGGGGRRRRGALDARRRRLQTGNRHAFRALSGRASACSSIKSVFLIKIRSTFNRFLRIKNLAKIIFSMAFQFTHLPFFDSFSTR